MATVNVHPRPGVSRRTRLPRPQHELVVGQLRRQVRLDTDAVYRVQGWDDSHVRVQVVRAPGLTPGDTFTFTREAVQAMHVIRKRDSAT
jgi:hypothetical protein